MDELRYAALTERSQAIHGQKHVLPIAAWLIELGSPAAKTPEIARGLGGRLQSNEILPALSRIVRIGALEEMPHPGAPHPRVFSRRQSHPYWKFIRAIVTEVDQSLPDGPRSTASA